ncbi:VOC family protein [Parachitinimonas caeni]|uniref:VOC family protein n=1 Tax=Parachitinimonas caeni TaxID=3031301 RepID=A0ABT7DV18_9NEIS|nr:VOC family protein [Parachitinimonas caeni]MDK2123918.1 VOC family protein [Parachitinimonas caeni]
MNTSFGLKPHIREVVYFVADIDAAAQWYGTLFGAAVEYENPRYAFIRLPEVTLGFHPADAKNASSTGGAAVYWQVERLDAALAHLEATGAVLLRGPGTTDLGEQVCLLCDPFGNLLGLNQPATTAG